jgi:hypothetical protein
MTRVSLVSFSVSLLPRPSVRLFTRPESRLAAAASVLVAPAVSAVPDRP